MAATQRVSNGSKVCCRENSECGAGKNGNNIFSAASLLQKSKKKDQVAIQNIYQLNASLKHLCKNHIRIRYHHHEGSSLP